MSNDPAQPIGDVAPSELIPEPTPPGARAHERAPRILKRAAVLLVWGSLLPWTGEGTWQSLLDKCYVIVGCSLILSGVYALHEKRALSNWFRRPLFANRRGALGLFTGFHLLGSLSICWGVIQQVRHGTNWIVLAEFVTLLLGALTYVHIANYQKGGKFNPLYPLLFGACAIGGVFALSGRVRASEWLAAAGCALVTLAGVLALITIVVAMIQAKKAGDLRRIAVQEARRQEHASAGAPTAGRDSTR